MCPFFSVKYCPCHCLGTYEEEREHSSTSHPVFIQVSASLAAAAASNMGKESPAQLQAGERGREMIITRDAPNLAARGSLTQQSVGAGTEGSLRLGRRPLVVFSSRNPAVKLVLKFRASVLPCFVNPHPSEVNEIQ